MICGPIQIGDSQRQLVNKKTKTNSSRSICLHFSDLFIYLFINSLVSLSWRYKPPQPELPRIPSLNCTVPHLLNVRSAVISIWSRAMLIIFPASSKDAFSAASLPCQCMWLKFYSLKPCFQSYYQWLIGCYRLKTKSTAVVRCYNLKHVVRGVDRWRGPLLLMFAVIEPLLAPPVGDFLIC